MGRKKRMVIFAAAACFCLLLLILSDPEPPGPPPESASDLGGALHPVAGPDPGGPAGPEPGGLVEVVVRELEFGEPAAGLEFTEDGGRGDRSDDRPFRTDHRGLLRLPVKGLRGLRPVGPGWRRAALEEAAGRGERTLWVYRLIRVEVFVHGSDGREALDPTTVTLRAEIPGEGILLGFARARPPWTGRWMYEHRVLPIGNLPNPDADGRVTIELPAISGLVLTGLSSGWRRASARVRPGTPNAEVATIELRLTRRSHRVEGRLVTIDGRPLTSALVRLYVSRYVPTDGFLIDDLRLPDCGFTALIDEGKGVARVNWILDTLPAGEDSVDPGSFSFDVEVDGQVKIVVIPDGGRRVSRRDLGALAESISGMRIVVEDAADESKLLITHLGKPLGGAILAIGDITDERFETSFRLVADSEGRVETNLFDIGRRYSLTVRWKGKPRPILRTGFIVWESQDQIEVSELKK